MEKNMGTVLDVQNQECVQKEGMDISLLSLGDASELTLGNGCNTFENFGSKWN